MILRLRYLMAAGAVAAMLGAPTALADTAGQPCSDVGGGTECSSPGNVQINDAPPPVLDAGPLNGFYGGPYPVPFDEGNR